MNETVIDVARLDARLAAVESSLGPALDAEVSALGGELKARIEAKLSGAVLATKSGALLASLALEPESGADHVLMHVASRGLPYARIQEFGGKTAAHEILAIKAKALAFVTGGRIAFAKSVHHPGSVIPQHSFMQNALDDMHEEIVAELDDAIVALMRGA